MSKKDKKKKEDKGAKVIGNVFKVAFPGSVLFDADLRNEVLGKKKKKKGKK